MTTGNRLTNYTPEEGESEKEEKVEAIGVRKNSKGLESRHKDVRRERRGSALINDIDSSTSTIHLWAENK